MSSGVMVEAKKVRFRSVYQIQRMKLQVFVCVSACVCEREREREPNLIEDVSPHTFRRNCIDKIVHL